MKMMMSLKILTLGALMASSLTACMNPLQAGMELTDLSRVLQGVTAGIGFLGAGAILKLQDENQIVGLTTAASIWLTAAVGIAAGMGREGTAVVSALFAFIILSLLKKHRPAHPPAPTQT